MRIRSVVGVLAALYAAAGFTGAEARPAEETPAPPPPPRPRPTTATLPPVPLYVLAGDAASNGWEHSRTRCTRLRWRGKPVGGPRRRRGTPPRVRRGRSKAQRVARGRRAKGAR